MSKLLLMSALGLSAALSLSGSALAETKPTTSPAAMAAEAPKAPAAPQPKMHVVSEGDSLSSIAEAEKLESWRPLWNANAEVQNPDLVYAGQNLVVPAAPVAERALPQAAVVQQPVAATPGGYQASARQYDPAKRSTTAPANYAAGAGGWAARVKQLESGGNYATNTGNGYYGAYQFDQRTWRGVGGSGLPSDASPAEQDMRAQMLYNQRGCSPWPNTCK